MLVDVDKQRKLSELRQKMLEDKSLPLGKGATQLVFGEGNPDADIMCIGEGPGYWEDKKGRPFVGNAGAFLNQLLLLAGLKRSDVFITNVVHHRPPGNRDPEAGEIEAYRQYLDEMISIISPKVIVTLGRFSMGKFLPNARITSVHGKKFDINWKGRRIVVVPMYHPAAGLRSGEVRKQTIEDFKRLPEILERIKKEDNGKKEEIKQMSLI